MGVVYVMWILSSSFPELFLLWDIKSAGICGNICESGLRPSDLDPCVDSCFRLFSLHLVRVWWAPRELSWPFAGCADSCFHLFSTPYIFVSDATPRILVCLAQCCSFGLFTHSHTEKGDNLQQQSGNHQQLRCTFPSAPQANVLHAFLVDLSTKAERDFFFVFDGMKIWLQKAQHQQSARLWEMLQKFEKDLWILRGNFWVRVPLSCLSCLFSRQRCVLPKQQGVVMLLTSKTPYISRVQQDQKHPNAQSPEASHSFTDPKMLSCARLFARSLHSGFLLSIWELDTVQGEALAPEPTWGEILLQWSSNKD